MRNRLNSQMMKRVLVFVLAAAMVFAYSAVPFMGIEGGQAAAYADSAAETDQQKVNAAAKAFNEKLGSLKPDFEADKNIIDTVKESLKGGVSYLDDLEVEVMGTSDEKVIGLDGTIHYYADKLGEYGYNQLNCDVSFRFTLGSAHADTDAKTAVVGWDRTYYGQKIQEEADAFREDSILGQNTSLDNVTSDLTLPQLMTDSVYTSWSYITWTSSNPSVIEIKDGDEWGIPSTPKIGHVKAPASDTKVTLTAQFSANPKQINETVDKAGGFKQVTKTIEVTVKGSGKTDETKKTEMQSDLDQAFSTDKITVFGSDASGSTAAQADLSAVDTDLQLPKARNLDFDTANYRAKISYESENPDYVTINGYRAMVTRPLPGAGAETVKIRVVLSSSTEGYEGITASKEIEVTVIPLTQKEIDDAKTLMNRVKASYWDGIRGENSDAKNVTKNMSRFYEARPDGNGGVFFAKNVNDVNYTGIEPDTWLEDTSDVNQGDEQYTSFKSSNTNVVASSSLALQGQPAYDTEVTVSSYLTHEVFGKYYKKYKDAGDEEHAAIFRDLYRQPVSAQVTVKGAQGADPEPEKEISVRVKVQSHEAVLVPERTVSVAKGSTAYDALRQALEGTGYSLLGSADYISGVKYPDGTELTDKTEAFGGKAGWMYHVNGEAPSVMLNKYLVNNGDLVLFYFITDYTKSMDPVDLDQPKAASYEISLAKSKYGKVTASADQAKAGEEITLQAAPKAGYQLKYIQVNGKKIKGKTFLMPEENVRVEAFYSLKKYTIKVKVGKGGKLSSMNTPGSKLKRKGSGGSVSAGYGKTVKITVRAKKGYRFVKWTKSGRKVKTGKYSKVSNRKSKGKVVKSVLTLRNVKKGASYKAVFAKR